MHRVCLLFGGGEGGLAKTYVKYVTLDTKPVIRIIFLEIEIYTY